MTLIRNKQSRSLFGRRQAAGVTVTDYHLSDIRENEPVYVASSAAVAGDLYAPRIVIAGLVYGFVIAKEVVVEAGGVVWGDIYAQTVQVEGQLNGWVSTIHLDEYVALHAGQLEVASWVIQRSEAQPERLPEELQRVVQQMIGAMPPDRVNILRRLQVQLGTAVTARLELENTMEQRISEIAGDAINDTQRLRERVGTLTNEQAQIQREVSHLDEQIRLKEGEITAGRQLLQTAQSNMDQLSEQIDDLRGTNELRYQEILHLQQQIEQTEQALQQMSDKHDAGLERNKNLEIALQTSLQRSAELDEALVRWQELAEMNEERVKDLETQTVQIEQQQRENSQTATILREQRDYIEKQWELAQDEIEQLQRHLAAATNASSGGVSEEELRTAVAQAVQEIQTELDRKSQELHLTRQAMVDGTAALAQLKQEINNREATLQQTQQQHQQQLATAEQTVNKLNQQIQIAKNRLAQKDSQVSELQTKLHQAGATTDSNQLKRLEAQVEAARSTAAVAQQRTTELTAELEKAQAALAATTSEQKQLRDNLRNNRHIIEAHEADLEEYQRQLTRQGSQLAEMRNELVEREIYLSRVTQGARKQADELSRIKQLASQRIKALEQELAENKKKLQDLTAYIDRLRRRNG